MRPPQDAGNDRPNDDRALSPSGATVAKVPNQTQANNAARPAERTGLLFDGRTRVTCAWADTDVTDQDYTIYARIKTRFGGTIFSNTSEGKWVPGGKALFVRGGRLAFDIGWVNTVTTERTIDDDQWHNVTVTYVHEEELVQVFIDGSLEKEANLDAKSPQTPPVVHIGYGAADYPNPTFFQGQIAEVRFYKRRSRNIKLPRYRRNQRAPRPMPAGGPTSSREQPSSATRPGTVTTARSRSGLSRPGRWQAALREAEGLDPIRATPISRASQRRR